MRLELLILDGCARAGLTVHCCQPLGLSLLMPAGVCVGGTFKQIQVAAQLSVQLKHCVVSCIWAGRKWAGGQDFWEGGYATLPPGSLGLSRCRPSRGRN